MGFLCTFIAALLSAVMLLNDPNCARDNCRCLRGNNEYADPQTGAVAMVCNDTVESATPHFEYDLHVDRSTVQSSPLTNCPSRVGLKAKDASSKFRSSDDRYQKHEDGPVPSPTLRTNWKHVRKILSDPGAMGEKKSTPILHFLSKVSTSRDTIDLPSAPGFYSFWKVPTGLNPINEHPATPAFPSSWKVLPIPKSLEEPTPASPVLDFLWKVPNAPYTVNKLSTTPAVSSVWNAPFAPRNDLPEVLAHLGSGHATKTKTFKNVKGAMIKKRTGLIPDPRSLREVPSGPDIPPPHANV